MTIAAVSSADIEPEVGPEPAPADERRLVERIRSGDRAAAEELVDASYGVVFASLVRMCGDRDLAADLTQETYRKAWESFGSFDGRSRFATWLYRIAYTTFLNHVRRPRRVVSYDDDPAPEIRDERASVEETIAERQENERLRKAVLGLSEELRFTVTAHFWGDLAVKEIAELEKITTVAVRKRLNKAYSVLEAALKGRP